MKKLLLLLLCVLPALSLCACSSEYAIVYIAEPSGLALFANRAGGALAVVLAVIIFFI